MWFREATVAFPHFLSSIHVTFVYMWFLKSACVKAPAVDFVVAEFAA